jgi:hypothetical protein
MAALMTVMSLMSAIFVIGTNVSQSGKSFYFLSDPDLQSWRYIKPVRTFEGPSWTVPTSFDLLTFFFWTTPAKVWKCWHVALLQTTEVLCVGPGLLLVEPTTSIASNLILGPFLLGRHIQVFCSDNQLVLAPLSYCMCHRSADDIQRHSRVLLLVVFSCGRGHGHWPLRLRLVAPDPGQSKDCPTKLVDGRLFTDNMSSS